MTLLDDCATEIRRAFADAAVRGWLHARPVDAPSGPDGRPVPEIDVDADDDVVMASVFKLPVLVAFARAVDDGTIDPRRRVTVDPSTVAIGPTGISVLLDPVTTSLRDLASSMITVSDNAAGDVLLEEVGFDRIRSTLDALGLPRTRVVRGAAATYDEIRRELGAPDPAAGLDRLADPDDPPSPSAYDPVLASSTTPREMTALLTALWRDTAASPEQCAAARRLLGLRVHRQRLAAGFPYDDVQTAGKTGTLGALRAEVGTVTHPGEPAVAVAVFTHAARTDQVLPRADAVIGQAAHLAVSALRLSREDPEP